MQDLAEIYCKTIRTRNVSGVTSVERMCDVVIDAMGELNDVLNIDIADQPDDYTEFLADSISTTRRFFERIEYLLLIEQAQMEAITAAKAAEADQEADRGKDA